MLDQRYIFPITLQLFAKTTKEPIQLEVLNEETFVLFH